MNNLPDPEIVLERGACLVLNKPGGLLTQGPPGIDSLELRVKNFLKIRDEKPGKVYLGVPHRLDRPVSGVMVVVKNVRAAKRIALQFQNRTVQKTYWAVVQGRVEPGSGTWQDWMRKIPDTAQSEMVDEESIDSKKAILHYKVLDQNASLTWLEINLETGRTHQIRLQCSHQGHPIVGDELYGATSTFGPETFDIRKRWIALHARRIIFEHPISKETVDQSVDLPSHFEQFDFEFSR